MLLADFTRCSEVPVEIFRCVCAPQFSTFCVIIAEHFESLKSMAKMVNLNSKNC